MWLRRAGRGIGAYRGGLFYIAHDKVSLEKLSTLPKLQAKFRGGQGSDTQISRLRKGKPICLFLLFPTNAVKEVLEMGNAGVGCIVLLSRLWRRSYFIGRRQSGRKSDRA